MPGEEPKTIQVPYPLAMLLCDAVALDPVSDKKSIIGCFSAIYASQFPASHPAMAIFAELTDGRGKTPISVKVVDAAESEPPLFEMEQDVEFTDPRAVVAMECRLKGLIFPGPGEYRFQLRAGGEFLMERRLAVIPVEHIS